MKLTLLLFSAAGLALTLAAPPAENPEVEAMEAYGPKGLPADGFEDDPEKVQLKN